MPQPEYSLSKQLNMINFTGDFRSKNVIGPTFSLDILLNNQKNKYLRLLPLNFHKLD